MFVLALSRSAEFAEFGPEAASGDYDLRASPGGEQIGCRKAESGSGASDESSRMSHERFRSEMGLGIAKAREANWPAC